MNDVSTGLEGTTHDPSVLQEIHKFMDPVMPQQISAVYHSVDPQKKQTM